MEYSLKPKISDLISMGLEAERPEIRSVWISPSARISNPAGRPAAKTLKTLTELLVSPRDVCLHSFVTGLKLQA